MDPILFLIAWLIFGGKRSREWPKPRPTFPGGGDYPPPTKRTEQPPASSPPKMQPFPSAGWTAYSPPPAAVVQRALALLPRLPMGQWVIEADPSGRQPEVLVLYRKEPHPKGKTGITVYKKPSAIETATA